MNGFWADYGQGFWDRGLSLIFGFWVRISMVNEDENRVGFRDEIGMRIEPITEVSDDVER